RVAFFAHWSAAPRLYSLSLHDARPISFPRGGDEGQRAGLEEAPDLLHRERGLAGQGHGLLLCGAAASVMPQAATLRQSSTWMARSEEHTSELQSRENLVCRLLLEKKNK